MVGSAEIERQGRVTGLGRGVDHSGQLSGEVIEAACEAIGDYVEIFQAPDESSDPSRIATSAVRDADNGPPSSPSCASASGSRPGYSTATKKPASPISVPSPSTRRARNTLVGRHRWRLDRAHRRPRRPGSTSTPRCRPGLSGTASVSCPPTRRRRLELEALAADFRNLIEGAIAGGPGEHAQRLAVAGIPTSLASIELELEPYDPMQVHGHLRSLPTIQRMLSRLASAPLCRPGRDRRPAPRPRPDHRRRRGDPDRVDARFRPSTEIEVSEHDILYGAAIAAPRR